MSKYLPICLPNYLLVSVVLALASSASAATYVIDPAASVLEVHTAKGGLFKAGHTHDIRVERLSGEIEADPKAPQTAKLKIAIPAAFLKVVDPNESEKDRNDVQHNMDGDRVLDVARYPSISYLSRSVVAQAAGAGFAITVDGDLELHGIKQAVKLPAQVNIAGDQLTATGEVTIRQKDFGITPFKAGLGTVGVKNEVRITYSIVAKKQK